MAACAICFLEPFKLGALVGPSDRGVWPRQAFGAGNLQAMSLLLQRALILSCGLSCIIWAAWTQLYLVLPLLGM